MGLNRRSFLRALAGTVLGGKAIEAIIAKGVAAPVFTMTPGDNKISVVWTSGGGGGGGRGGAGRGSSVSVSTDPRLWTGWAVLQEGKVLWWSELGYDCLYVPGNTILVEGKPLGKCFGVATCHSVGECASVNVSVDLDPDAGPLLDIIKEIQAR